MKTRGQGNRNMEMARVAAEVMNNMTFKEYNQLSRPERFDLSGKWKAEMRERFPDKSMTTIQSAISYQLKKQY